jgi:membrane protease subunit HflK
VSELEIGALASVSNDSEATTLDPLREGYALTGDDNIVHVQMSVHYRILDAAEWAFYGARSEDALRAEATAAMVRSIGEMGVDRALSDGRKDLVAMATRRAQAGLDAAHSGLELSSLELTRLAPPAALARDFDAVQSAYIEAETTRKDALGFAASIIPSAQAGADARLQTARGTADTELAQAHGDADAFLALDREYRASPAVVRERLYRDAVERAIGSAGSVRWIPPPSGGKYSGFRITLSSPPSPARATSEDDDER